MSRPLEVFQALADPTRLRIVALVRRMELSIGELAQVLGQSQPRVSRHVKILAEAGLVRRRKEGSWTFLGTGASPGLRPLLAAIDSLAEGENDAWTKADIARLAAVQADRQEAAERYFAAHAGRWDKIRSLHVAESEVEAAMRRALGKEPLGRLIDIGTGTGRMLELFARRARSAIGIDRSPEMLRLARAKLAEAGLEGAELRQADMYALGLPDASADCIVLHQVLHYAQQPGAVIAEAARVLDRDGRLLIVDFAPHGFEELRADEAHARLGFADDQVAGWFEAAGIEGGPVEELEGGQLTVKLWLGRRKADSKFKVVAA